MTREQIEELAEDILDEVDNHTGNDDELVGKIADMIEEEQNEYE